MKQILTNNHFNIFIKIILKNEKFFNDIHNYMVSVNWTWNFQNNPPDIEEIKRNLIHLINQSVKSEHRIVATGGFTVSNMKDKLIIEFNEKGKPDIVTFKLELNINEIRLKKLNNII